MIKSIRLVNFFSFKDCVIDLNSGANVVVGINGSGKSNLFKAIKLLKEGVTGIGFKNLIIGVWGGFDAVFNYSNNVHGEIIVEYELDYNFLKKNNGFTFIDNVFYKITINKVPFTSNFFIEEKIYHPKELNISPSLVFLEISNGSGFALNISNATTPLTKYSGLDPQSSALYKDITDPDRYFPLASIRKAIEDISVYDYFNTTPSSKIRKPILATSEQKLMPDGGNLAQVLNTLNISDKVNYRQIKGLLATINEAYTDFDFNFIGGNIELMLEEQHFNKSVHVTHISDGTLCFLCLLAILYNEKRGKVVCIDEPEIGLHPDMVRAIAKAIKHSSKTSQVLIATHSENLLNNFDLEEIRVFEKDGHNATIVKSFKEETFKDWYDNFSVGKMWRQGDLGGNRY